MASCCPPGSISSRNAEQAGANSPPVGTNCVLDDAFKTRLYHVFGKDQELKGVIVLVHDIFGLSSGRTRHVADEIASWGYLVVAPDFYDDHEDKTTDYPTWRTFFTGPAVPAFARRSRMPFDQVKARLEQSVLPWIASQPRERELPMGLLGFCWGGWAVTRFAATGKFLCAVGAHPAPDLQALQSTGPTTKQMYAEIKCPMLYLPARNDPAWIKENGSAWLAIKQASPQSSVQTFPTMEHGWVNRGDLRDESVLREVQSAMQFIKDFYAQHLIT